MHCDTNGYERVIHGASQNQKLETFTCNLDFGLNFPGNSQLIIPRKLISDLLVSEKTMHMYKTKFIYLEWPKDEKPI